MRKVRYINKNPGANSLNYLTYGTVYDVVEYIPGRTVYYDKIKIVDKYGLENIFYLYAADGSSPLFKDITSTYRNEIIDNILS